MASNQNPDSDIIFLHTTSDSIPQPNVFTAILSSNYGLAISSSMLTFILCFFAYLFLTTGDSHDEKDEINADTADDVNDEDFAEVLVLPLTGVTRSKGDSILPVKDKCKPSGKMVLEVLERAAPELKEDKAREALEGALQKGDLEVS